MERLFDPVKPHFVAWVPVCQWLDIDHSRVYVLVHYFFAIHILKDLYNNSH
jgi:hypothetical protein